MTDEPNINHNRDPSHHVYGVVNARVLTMDPASPLATTLLVRDGRIASVNEPIPDGVTHVDCGGATIVPGFIDPHVHLLSAAAARAAVDCSPKHVHSIRDLQAILASARPDATGWVRATGYDEQALTERRHPTRWELDRAVPHNPVRLVHRTGHALVLNSVALAAVDITIASAEPPGGVIDRRIGDGEPSGLLLDMDATVARVVPPLPIFDVRRNLAHLAAELLRYGITAVQDLTPTAAATDPARMPLRASLWPSVVAADGVAYPRLLPSTGDADGPVKLMLPEAAGLDAAARHAAIAQVLAAHHAGRQVAIHATTIDGVTLALDASGQALAAEPRLDHRHRIEHASLCDPEQAQRAARLGVHVVSNPILLHQRGSVYQRTIAAAQHPLLYAVEAMRRSGVIVAAASDAPVAPAQPLLTVRAAMHRRDANGAVVAGERMSLNNALALVTQSAATVARAEHERGRIAPGMAADLVILDGDAAWDGATVAHTLMAGIECYRATTAPQRAFPRLATPPTHRRQT